MARSDEVQAALGAYVGLRERIERGEATWTDLAGIFTDDAVFIDPAYGRVEGLEAIRRFLDESMRGLEDWRFPIEFTAVDGDNAIIKWTQLLPNGRRQSGYTRLIYAGSGKFRYEEDQLNMVHVLDDMRALGWRPAPDFVRPPAAPDRNFSVP
jgi:ketosteroid isomerase-like protein